MQKLRIHLFALCEQRFAFHCRKTSADELQGAVAEAVFQKIWQFYHDALQSPRPSRRQAIRAAAKTMLRQTEGKARGRCLAVSRRRLRVSVSRRRALKLAWEKPVLAPSLCQTMASGA